MKQTLNIARLQKLPTSMPYKRFIAMARIYTIYAWEIRLKPNVASVCDMFFFFLYINVSAGPIARCLYLPNRSITHKYIMFNIKCTVIHGLRVVPKWYIYKIAIWTTIQNMWRRKVALSSATANRYIYIYIYIWGKCWVAHLF